MTELDQKEAWCIWLGSIHENPKTIYHKWKKQHNMTSPPTCLSGRQGSISMSMNLIAILKGNMLIDNILTSAYDTFSLVNICDGGFFGFRG